VIGNDIVDLSYARKHNDWTRKGFLNKVFTSNEQNYITQTNDPFTTVWRLWSMKESVYKLHLRSKKIRSFYPSLISCELKDEKIGIVSYEDVEYKVNTDSFEDNVFSFTTSSEFREVNHKIMKYTSVLPENYYTIIKINLAKHLECNYKQIEILKNGVGIPHLYLEGVKQHMDISITHHGKYLAWSTIN